MPNKEMNGREVKENIKWCKMMLNAPGMIAPDKDRLHSTLNLIQEYEELKKAVESAGEELPLLEEQHNIINGFCFDVLGGRYRIEPEDFPRLCDYLKEQFLPILAKYKLRVEELESQIKEYMKAGLEVSRDITIENDKLKEELETAQHDSYGLALKLEALRGKVDVGKIEIWLETYKFPIITETDEYGDNDKVTRADFAQKLVAEYFEEGGMMPIKKCPKCKSQLKRNRKGGHRLYCPVCKYVEVA